MNEKKLHEFEPLWNSWYIDSLIGEGSFGSVYRIVREEFGEKYYSALKVISIPKNQNEIKQVYFEGMDNESASHYFSEIVEDIYKEIVLMSKLKGKTNIVSYEDHQILKRKDEVGYDILIRMELLQGLNEYATNKKMTNLEVIKMGKDICNALILCQKQDIMHRDIKPDNIFVSKDGDFKLGDFGIAKKVEKTESAMSIKGSYEYMAPEVYLGKEYDSRVDIYSLGIVLYTFLNNRKIPFIPAEAQVIRHGERQEALRSRFRGESIPKPVLASEALSNVVLKAIDYDPNKRYMSAEEFLEALSNLKEEDILETIQSNVSYNHNISSEFNNVNTILLDDLDKTVMLNDISNDDVVDFEKTVLLDEMNNIGPELIKKPFHKEEKERSYFIYAVFLFLLLTIGIMSFVIIKLNESNIAYLKDSSTVENIDNNSTEIDMSGKKMKSIDNVKKLDTAVSLDLSNNQINNISKLSSMTKLKKLNLENNSIKDISPIKSLVNLTDLNVSGNKIKNISPIYNLHNLKYLNIKGVSITKKDLDKLNKALPKCRIKVK
ncbi:protein kinase domain-containing protein [Anaeromicropila herbilytica]|uniref:Protein kinase domain-containing protein n=1 Tax=Anaeromicropila herbilytica TaxID=2785025 RepID=A0A7R7EPZ2_9FIRM|nr:protein kinase [Anaeromicropila herbilytica]BCN32357.1 hypothetical protein bsdtb5_36520 [Anaeromicropila herbilytica]